MIMEHKGDLHPQIVIEDERGQSLEVHYIPERAYLEVARRREGRRPARCWPRRRAKCGGTQDITGGLPRVTEIFEARKPRDPAVMAEIAGRVAWANASAASASSSSSRWTTTASRSARSKEHQVPHGKHLRVHTGDYVKDGDPLVDGPLVPHDILRISGIEAVQNYLVREVQSVYRSQRVDIDDKHIEIIVSQMLRKVKVEDDGRHRPVARARSSTSSRSAKVNDRLRASA